MKIWLVTVGEPLPIDNDNIRQYRVGLLADMLGKRGHEVVWWSSTLDHIKKKQRCDRDKEFTVSDKFTVILLHGIAYKTNVSFKRFVNHWQIARKFNVISLKKPKPDIIIASMPTIELALAAVSYAKKHGLPSVVDIRDLWPDIFVDLAPKGFRGVARFLLSPLFRDIRQVCSKATALIGVNDTFVSWGLNYANRERKETDRFFPLAYSSSRPNDKEIDEVNKFWESRGVSSINNKFVVCFFGNDGNELDLETVIQGINSLPTDCGTFQFVLCGNLERFRILSKSNSIIFPGWVNATQIWSLMRIAKTGLVPYRSGKDFINAIPNKAVEYLSAGLPILSSLKGKLQNTLEDNSCGLTFKNFDSDDFVRLLKVISKNPSSLESMSMNSHRLYLEQFEAGKIYGEMCDYFEEIVVNSQKIMGEKCGN